MGVRRRGDNRNDPLVDEIVTDPEITMALTAQRTSYDRMKEAVGHAIQETDGRKLKGWVAVCVWEDADGNEERCLLGDDHTSGLELKGFLHDGLWMAAHTD